MFSWKKSFLLGLLGLISLSLAQSVNAAPRYKITALGTLDVDLGMGDPVPESAAYAINNVGQVVGSAKFNWGNKEHAFLWENGAMHDLGALGSAYNSIAYGINDRDQVVGMSYNRYEGDLGHAFLWENGSMRDLDTFGASQAYAINNSGQVVGWSLNSVSGAYRAALWENGAMRELGTFGDTFSYSVANDINDIGQVVGWSDSPEGKSHGFFWEKGAMYDLGVGVSYGINNVGQVVGKSGQNLFLWENGSMNILGTFGNFEPSDINDAGQIVGSAWDSNYGYRGAFLWEKGSMYNLNDLLLSNSGVNFVQATGINNDGQIVGIADHYQAFLATPVPEPLSMFLLSAGFPLLIMKRRKRTI